MKNRFLFAGVIAAFGLQAQTVSDTIQYSGAIVTYTIPACVSSVTIDARGAQGGYTGASSFQAGMGARMIGDFIMTPGAQLRVLVGQNNNAGNGGGGGTYVTDIANAPLIVAGGGGGASGVVDSPNKHGQTGTTGATGAGGGGVGGTAGGGGFIGASFAAGAGGGLLTDGQNGWTANTAGLAFVNGGAGGTAGWGLGGFGGGGNGSGNQVGGGGGGYSGGGAGSNSAGAGVGGGGGSYNGGTNQVNSGGVVVGNGLVIITYTMGPTVIPSVTGINLVCENDTITLTTGTVPGAISYNWTVPGSATILSGQTTTSIVLAAGSVSGTVSVTVTDVCGTSAPGTFSYTVNPIPVVSVTSTSTVVCEGSSVTMTASGATNYSWSSGGTDTTEMIVATSSTTYTVIGSDAIGCSDTATQLITVNMNPTVNLGNDTIVCSPLVLDAANAGSAYLWNDNSTAQMNTGSSSGSYSVMITDVNGCTDNDTINVSVGGNFTVVGSAAMNFACTGEPTIQLFESPAGGTWNGAGVFGSTFEPDTAGVGTHDLVYTYTDSLGCSGMDTISITVDLCLGTTTPVSDLQTPISLYPNPNNGTFTIAFNNSMDNVIVEMVDVNGRAVFAQQYDVNAGDQKQLDLSGEANGMYLLRVTSANGVNTQRVLINR